MEMIEVQSSQIAAVGYDGDVLSLLIQFRRGETYEYADVSRELYDRLMASPSIGNAFTRYIKGNPAHLFRRVVEGEAVSETRERTVVLDPEPVVNISGPGVASNVQVQVLEEESTDLSHLAKTLRVVDRESEEVAAGMLRDIGVMRGKIAVTWKPMKEAAHKAHRVVCEQEKAVDAPLLEAEFALKQQIRTYADAERQRVRAEEERLHREERKRAELEATAESERLALDDALKLEAEGEVEAAEAVLSNPLPIAARYVPPPPVIPQRAQTSGVSTREVWKYRITDEALIPRQYLCVDEKRIGGVVRAMGGKTNIPGIEAYVETSVAVRRSA